MLHQILVRHAPDQALYQAPVKLPTLTVARYRIWFEPISIIARHNGRNDKASVLRTV